MTFDLEHSARWQDRLQDSIDGALAATEQAELQTHLATCEQCRYEYSRLTALHGQLRATLSVTPTMSADFSDRVFAHIDEHEHARKLQAKALAEREFRRRLDALELDWRRFLRRHAGNLIAALTVVAALIAALGPTWNSLVVEARELVNNLPWIHHPEALSIAGGIASASIAAASLWWLRSKAQ